MVNQTTAYISWRNMIKRCNNPKDNAYKNYGGRGIVVCDRWLLYSNFLEDMGERPQDLTLDRIDNNGNYEPGNCRWATRAQQNSNTRANKRYLYAGRNYTLTEWCLFLNMHMSTFIRRQRNGWELEKILTTPTLKNNQEAMKRLWRESPEIWRATHANTVKTHCKHGHEFTAENTFMRVTKSGERNRQCRECKKARLRRYYHKKKALAMEVFDV